MSETLTYDYTSVWQENPLQALEIPTSEIIVLPALSGRSEYKRSKEKVKELTASIQATGQIQPAIVGVNTDEQYGPVGAPILHVGFGRYEACVAAERPLLCMYSATPIAEVLARGAHENTKREDLSPMQVAALIERMRGEGKKDNEIARDLGVKPASVSVHARFLAKNEDGSDLFSKFAKTQIHNKVIPMRAAYQLADLSTSDEIDNAIKAELDEAEKTGTKITSAPIIAKVRKAVKKSGKKTKKGKAIKKGRSIKEVTAFLEAWDVAGVPPAVRKTIQQVVAFVRGETDEDGVEKVLMKIAA